MRRLCTCGKLWAGNLCSISTNVTISSNIPYLSSWSVGVSAPKLGEAFTYKVIYPCPNQIMVILWTQTSGQKSTVLLQYITRAVVIMVVIEM